MLPIEFDPKKIEDLISEQLCNLPIPTEKLSKLKILKKAM